MGTPAQDRIDELEAWWALLARVLAFIAGVLILGWETVLEQGDRPYIIVAGIGLCGPVVAQSVAAVFTAIRGGGANE